MINLNKFRESLCEIGRKLFDSLPAVASSYGQFNFTEEPKFETEPEEVVYKEHVEKCKICSNVIRKN